MLGTCLNRTASNNRLSREVGLAGSVDIVVVEEGPVRGLHHGWQ